jgi:hypothetical protein
MEPDIAPRDLKRRVDAREPLVLLDVRDGWEAALWRLERAPA